MNKNLRQVWNRKYETFFLIVMALLAGCASAPDITSTEKSGDQRFSAAEIREITIDHPQFVSGDFFREREQTTSKTTENTPTENDTVEKERARLDSQKALPEPQTDVTQAVGTSTVIAASSDAPQATEQMKIKVAVLMDRRQVRKNNANLLTDSIHTNATRFPVVLVTPMEIETSLSPKKKVDPKDLVRVSRELAVYPGVRMLALIEEFQLPATFPGKARAVVHLMDAGILHRYPSLEFSMTLTNEADANLLADNVVRTAFDTAVGHSTLTPWFCMAFSNEQQVWYVNAGKASGLQTGDRLKVVTGGKLITAPSGIPAGWIPGETKGTLQVDLHFGRDLAACSLIDGTGPEDGDLLIK